MVMGGRDDQVHKDWASRILLMLDPRELEQLYHEIKSNEISKEPELYKIMTRRTERSRNQKV
jgi:hypothetical protein